MKLTPEYVRDTLLKLGFSPKNEGFPYIVEAVMIIEDDPDAAYNTVKKIYIPISENYGVRYQTIERCIRHSIESAMIFGYEKIPDFLHCQPTAASGSYKNADFLAALHIALHRE
jgi:hypothetical protein